MPANGKVYVVIRGTKALAAFHYLGDAKRCAAEAGGRAAGVRTSRVPYTDSLNSNHYYKRNGRVIRYRQDRPPTAVGKEARWSSDVPTN